MSTQGIEKYDGLSICEIVHCFLTKSRISHGPILKLY